MQPSPAPLILLLLQALLSTAAVLRPNVNNKPTVNQEGIAGYNILDCGDREAKLIEIVDLARKSVLPAIEDLSHPNVDSHTFEALIGPKPRLAKAILPLLVAVRDFLGVGGREPAWYKDDPPIFMCVQENTQQLHPELENIVDPHKYCQDRTDAWAFSDTRFRYIFLCDRFWDPEHKPEPETPRAEREACPRFEANMFMDEDGERLASFQKYLIVHELLHMYMLDGGLRDDSDPKEVYSLNDCMRMNYETNRIRNPNNVVYYVASEFVPPLLNSNVLILSQ